MRILMVTRVNGTCMSIEFRTRVRGNDMQTSKLLSGDPVTSHVTLPINLLYRTDQ